MRHFAVASTLLAAAACLAQEPTLNFTPASFLFEFDGFSAPVERVGIKLEIETIEYKDSMDAHVRKRPGRTTHVKIRLDRGSVSNRESFDALLSKVLNGVTERKSGSIVYLDREGNEKLRQTVGDFGDLTAIFPGTGELAGDGPTSVAISGHIHLHKEGIIHRDIAARNLTKPGKAVVLMGEADSLRALDCAGSSPFEVHRDTGDLDGDGAPDITESVRAGEMSLILGATEAAMIAEWRKSTEFAATLDIPYTRPLSIQWPLPDGGVYEVTMFATFLGATPLDKARAKVDLSLEQVKAQVRK